MSDDLLSEETIESNNNAIPSDKYNSLEFTPMQEESSALAKWRLEHDEFLARKASASEEKHSEIKARARQEVEEFYQKRAQQKEKNEKATREAEEKYLADRDALLSADTNYGDWERVNRFIDFKQGHVGEKDTSRMRKILIELKH